MFFPKTLTFAPTLRLALNPLPLPGRGIRTQVCARLCSDVCPRLTYARVLLMNTRVGVGPLDDVLDGEKQTLWTLRAWRGQAYQVHRTSLRHRRDPRPTAELTTLHVTSRSSSSMAWMTTPGDVSAASVNGPLCGKTLNILSAISFGRFSKRQSHSNIFLERPGWLS
jgi:hypothetical protein